MRADRPILAAHCVRWRRRRRRVMRSGLPLSAPFRGWRWRARLYTVAVREALEQKLSTRQRLALALVPPLAAMLIRLLGSTLRYVDLAESGVTPGYAISGPTVFAFWHRSLLACAYRFRELNIAILISSSFDGELIARTVERLGFKAIRGSSSHGGAAGLRNMQLAYLEGHRCAFTADGPRGPAWVAKPGVAHLANSVGGPPRLGPDAVQPPGTWVGSFYALPDRAWELKSWDRFLIPKPFSRVVLTWPKHVPAGQVTTERVQANLDRAVQMARQFRYRKRSR